uniref:Uncharacterized protein n=1 Tax=viral metagenome TaxID=1070528 RepID=A0A6M3KJP5_9ZZZZ
MSELSDLTKLERDIPVMFKMHELVLLHKLVDRAHRLTVETGNESLELKDMEARLATGIELSVDELSYREAIVSMLPEHLQSAVRRLIVYNNGEHVATAVWSEEDVFEKAKEKGMKISREQAQEVLAEIDRKQDASLGITWDTIDCYLDDLEEEVG